MNIDLAPSFTSVELGDTHLKVVARGRFLDKDARDFVPTPESLLLHIDTPFYDGPLDLLLHLIKKHSMDIFDIPIMTITAKYLEALDEYKKLNLDVAGEFLVMAATLAEIKSKMLLPKEERAQTQEFEEEEGEDPRLALTKRLLLYKTYQEASLALLDRPMLGKDWFLRPVNEEEQEELEEGQEIELAKFPTFDLIEKLAKVLKKSETQVVHTIDKERISISARINEMMDFCQLRAKFTFFETLKFFPVYEKIDVIVNFLAILEMSRLKLLRLNMNGLDELFISVVKENFYSQAQMQTLLGDKENYDKT